MSKKKELVRSFTKDEFDVQPFRCGGPGGQAQNKLETGIRIVHKETGIAAESRVHRSQHQNKMAALRKLAQRLKDHFWPVIPKERAPCTTRIRTYHEPRHTATDHRTGKSYDYYDVMYGNGLEKIHKDLIESQWKD